MHKEKSINEIAVECYFYDKTWRFLWTEFKSFNELPDVIQELYLQEARAYHGVR